MLQLTTPPSAGIPTDLYLWLLKLQSSLAQAKSEVEVLWIGDAIDGASAPAALATKTSTHKVNTRDFDGASDEDVYFIWRVPHDCVVSSGIKFRVICMIVSATAPANETFQFEMHGFCAGSSDTLAGTLGTAQTSNSGTLANSNVQYDFVTTAWSSAMTSTHITDLTAGEFCVLKLYRDTDDTDTYGQDVGVIAVELKYKRTHDIKF